MKEKILNVNEKTPSKSEYFSWINNTLEGATENHTLINLEFFKFLREKYGMVLDVYALDAGNLDGAIDGYEKIDSEKIKKQYPNGYAPLVKKAKEVGARMGIWCGPDGYGETKEEAEERRSLLVNLCKDYNWALLKLDSVCGKLREEKRVEFEKTILDCLKYSNDLIVLQHFNFGEENEFALPFLWAGEETYIDVHAYNKITAPHNRAYMFFRGHSPNLTRLGEDHGVCLSSCIDFFEDELIYQAFNRCLILAPEIYANPWLLRDDEYPKLAYIFNLHRRYRDILVNGMIPKGDMGNDAVIRGDEKRRFLATGNASWNDKIIEVELNESVGLAPCESVIVSMRFPTNKFIGQFNYGDKVNLTLAPFRATLVEICSVEVANEELVGCEYEVLRSGCGKIGKVNVLSVNDEILLFDPKTNNSVKIGCDRPVDLRLQKPKYIGELSSVEVPINAKELYENACFGLDNDSLEMRSLKRSGETCYEQVKNARDAFFNQKSYALRGCDGNIPFDKNTNTVYDTKSRLYYGGSRIEGGCLRVNFGGVKIADKIEIEFFSSSDIDNVNFAEQTVKDNAEVSLDLSSWEKLPLISVETVCNQTQPYYCVEDGAYYEANGVRMKAVFKVLSNKVAYLKIPEPVDKIYSIKLFNGFDELELNSAYVNNLFAVYESKECKEMLYGKFVMNSFPTYPYLSVACEGKTGCENVYCVARVEGRYYSFPSRAPSYPSNTFECVVSKTERNYTFYLPLDKAWENKEIEIFALFASNSVKTNVYLCDANGKREGLILEV